MVSNAIEAGTYGPVFLHTSDQQLNRQELPQSPEKPTEKCGVVGVFSTEDATKLTFEGLKRLQHRGQDTAGMSVFTPERGIITYKNEGLVSQAITPVVLNDFGKSLVAIGHCRYLTSDTHTVANAQPIMIRQDKYALAIGHNGNLFDTSWYDGIPIQLPGGSDTNKLTALVLWERLHANSWVEAFSRALTKVQGTGSISAVAITSDGELFGMTDQNRNRPLVISRLPSGWMIASESTSAENVGGAYMRKVQRNELIRITSDGKLNVYYYGTPGRPAECVFEDLYFSRPDSFDTIPMQIGREHTGEMVGQRMREKDIRPTIVVPIYDSGGPASKGIAKSLEIPVQDALVTDHYMGRIFIRRTHAQRVEGVNGKHSIIPERVQGQIVVEGDDTIVRGDNTPPIVQMTRDAGAQEVHLGIASPPVTEICDMGVNMRTREEQLASQWSDLPLNEIEYNVAKRIGADSVTYLRIEQVATAFQTSPDRLCYHCFGGPHPMRGEIVSFPERKRRLENGQAKIAVLISGRGTNLQAIIDEVEAGELAGSMVGVLSNKENSYGLVRAKSHGIDTAVLPSKGRLKDAALRGQYEDEILNWLGEKDPDVVVLAGWMVVLGDKVLSALQQREIIVPNLHPALLTEGNEETVRTSRGVVPVVRGTHAIYEAYDKKLPVSGVTVHQILPGNPFDTGPIIMKEEVRRRKEETFEEWETGIHEAEHRALPTALKRIIHVLQHNIDVSRGTYPW